MPGRRSLPRTLLLLLGVAVCGLLLPARAEGPVHPDEVRGQSTVAFHPGPEGATPVRGGTAILTLLGEVDSLNPFASSSADASEIHDLIFPRLYTEQADYTEGPPTFVPNLAEAPPVPGDDGLSLRIKLRECTWSDGVPITAEDVRFSWQAAADPDVAWVSASIVEQIEDIEIHSPREFTVHYRKCYPYQQMDVNDVQILPKHTFGKVPFTKWQTHGRWETQASVSGGPFLLESIRPNEVILARNPRYGKGSRPYLDKIIFRVIPDQRSQLTSVLSGGTDCMTGVPPKDVGKILDASHLRLYSYLTRGYGYIGWNCQRFPFDDARVRNAMSHAIDAEDIVESLFRGHAKIAAPQIISSFWASNSDIEPVEYDPDRSEELLEEAGWTKNDEGIYTKDGKSFRFTLFYNTGNSIRERICVMLQANLREIGVVAVIRPIEFNQMSTQLKKHEFDAYVGGWSVATKVDMKPTWHSSSVKGKFNYVSYMNPRVDEIITTARTMSDFEAARPLWWELQEILHRDQPYTMLYEPRGLVALDKRFQNVEVNALRVYANLDEWWVPKELQRSR